MLLCQGGTLWLEEATTLSVTGSRAVLSVMSMGSLVGFLQESKAKRHFELYLSTVQSGLGAVPDWKRTAFWHDSGFLQARRSAQERMQGRAEATDDSFWCSLLQPVKHLTCTCMCVPDTHILLCRRYHVACCAWFWGPTKSCGLPDRACTAQDAVAAQDAEAALLAHPVKAAAEKQEAHALLLAGQAGLCCNPRFSTSCKTHTDPFQTLQIPMSAPVYS